MTIKRGRPAFTAGEKNLRKYATQWYARALMATVQGKTKTEKYSVLEERLNAGNGTGSVWRQFEMGHRAAGQRTLQRMNRAWRALGNPSPEFAKALGLLTETDEIIEASERFWRARNLDDDYDYIGDLSCRTHPYEDDGEDVPDPRELDPDPWEDYDKALEILEKAIIKVETETGFHGDYAIQFVMEIVAKRKKRQAMDRAVNSNWRSLTK